MRYGRIRGHRSTRKHGNLHIRELRLGRLRIQTSEYKPLNTDTITPTTTTTMTIQHDFDDDAGTPFTRTEFKCCGRYWSSRRDFNRHMRSKRGEKPFPCDKCGKAFCDVDNLRKHFRAKHTEEKYVCSHTTCNYTSNYLCNKHRHM